MLPSKTPAMPAFVRLPLTGLAASMREFNGEPVKLFIRGNHGTRFHSHEHEDTGSFVLEYAGEAFAMDPGIAEYDDPRHQFMKQADWHNMLVPIVEGERATPEVQCETDVTPAAKGGRKAFHAKLDATPPWKKWFAKWIRTWDSPTPDGLTIRDEYRLNEGSGVRFCWQTGLACSVVGDSVIISGKRGGAILRPERGCRMNIEELPVIGDVVQKRISFEKSGREGTIEISVGLLANN